MKIKREVNKMILTEKETIKDLIDNFKEVQEDLYDIHSLIVSLNAYNDLPDNQKSDFSNPLENLTKIMQEKLENSIKLVDNIV